jgi:hypothetical protein
MKIEARTPAGYLAALPAERRKTLAEIRSLVRKHLPAGYVETMQYGMISYVVPLKRYAAGYLGRKDVPLPCIAIAAQKYHYAIYLMGFYGDAAAEREMKRRFAVDGKRLDMGKCCVRFKSLDEVSLGALEWAVGKVSVDAMIARYEEARGDRDRAGKRRRPAR